MEVIRIGPDGGFIKKISKIEESIKAIQTAPAGNIVIRDTLSTTDPVTGVKTILSPEGGLQQWVGDIEPPAKPSTPIITSRLGAFSVYWDGVGFLGEDNPPDYDRTDIEMSSLPDGPWFKVGELRGEGSVVVVDQVYNELRYFRLVSYDVPGNASISSDSVSGTLTPVVDEESISAEIGRIDQTLEDVNFDLTDLSDTLAPLPGKLTQLETDLGTLDGDLGQLELDLAPLPGKISQIEIDLAPLPGKISQIETDLAPIPGKLVEIENNLAPLPGRLTQLETDLGTLDGDLDQLELDLAPLPGKINQLELDLAPLPGQLEQLEADLAPIPGQITGIEEEIAPYPQMISEAASSVITDARLVEGSLTKWPFQGNTIPSGAFTPGAVSGNDIANFSLAVTKLQSNRHQIY